MQTMSVFWCPSCLMMLSCDAPCRFCGEDTCFAGEGYPKHTFYILQCQLCMTARWSNVNHENASCSEWECCGGRFKLLEAVYTRDEADKAVQLLHYRRAQSCRR